MVKPGDCVKIPDGRIGRVRQLVNGQYKVRVMRKSSQTYQFLFFKPSELEIVPCPPGWMSPEGYNSYLQKTLGKMKLRLNKK